MIVWVLLHPGVTMESLGFIPLFLNEDDPRPAREQINEAYKHGGGWFHFSGFEMLESGDLQFPGDPPIKRLAMTVFREEEISLYEHSWLVIKQPDGSWEVARID